MKIKFTILMAFFLVISSFSFAKEIKAADSSATKINVEIPKLKKDEDSLEVKSESLDKVFTQAEQYYKAAQSWEKLKCEPVTGFICTKWECNKRDIKASLVLDKKTNTITRCEGNTCDKYSAEFKQTGVFFNIQSEGPIGTLIRILGDSRYKEINTVGLDAYIVNGNCKPITD